MAIEIHVKKNEFGEIIFIGVGANKDFVCSECNKPLNAGFICENNNKKVLCDDCQRVYPMHHCRAGLGGVHTHIRFKRVEDESQAE